MVRELHLFQPSVQDEVLSIELFISQVTFVQFLYHRLEELQDCLFDL